MVCVGVYVCLCVFVSWSYLLVSLFWNCPHAGEGLGTSLSPEGIHMHEGAEGL